jgi:hypothetical protein
MFNVVTKPKTVWIAFADIKKAYDNVSLDSLDAFIKEEIYGDAWLSEEWQRELQDMRMLNMDINGEIILRTRGLPQGSELAPALFNYYLTRVLEEVNFDTNIEYFAFADNMVVIGYSKDLVEITIEQINDKLRYYELEFEMNEVEYLRIDEILKGFCTYPNDPESKMVKDTKFLGGTWSIINNKLFFDYQKFKFNLPKCIPQPGFQALKYAKKFIIPKYRFYANYLKTVDRMQIPRYKNWFYKEFTKWLQKSCIFQNIPSELIDEMIHPNKSDRNFSKFITVHLAYLKEIPIRKLNSKQISLLDRLALITKFVYNKQIKVGIYKAVNLLMKENLDVGDFAGLENCKGKQLRRVWMIMDLLYFGILNERRFSSLQFNEQQKYTWRSLRRSNRWPFFD